MKTIFQYLLLTAACAALGACQDFSDDTAFTPETPELSFVETSITAEKATKDYELSIKSNLPWRIECDKDWVSFDPSYGQGDATITVTVAANRTLDERTATISAYVIKGENVTLPVTQAAASASDLATHYYVKTDGSADKDGLTWETATTLANAIDQAMNGDVIHVAAGSYVPSVPLTGMKTALDNTFEIHSNFSMIGGYPADAAEGAVADPVANETILDGDHAVCHVVAVTAAKMNGMKVSLDGFTIKNGSSQFSSVGSTTIGGVKFYQSYGAGIFIGNATVDILNCKIVDNTDIRMGAIRVDAGAEALFDNCVVADNATKSTTTYNCGGLWADGAKLLRINNCTFSNNKASGVAPCIYVFGDTGGKTNVLISNTTISGNSVNPEHATLNGGGIYVRENGNLVIVNSTVCGNHSGKGGGIAVYGKVDKPSKAVIVSCTIAGNTTVTAGNGAGLQLVRSVGELLPDAKKIGARVVIENMLGYELVKDGNYERPLGRTVEEVLHIMSLVPREVDAAVDTNHIDNPELLISALGRRVRTIHVSDGDGRSECHELPGQGRGDNDWTAILKALYEDAHYRGVFMYEVKKAEFPQLKACYDRLYEQYVQSKQ